MNLPVVTLRSTTGYHLIAPPWPEIPEFKFASRITSSHSIAVGESF
jgi:hypothetical protein